MLAFKLEGKVVRQMSTLVITSKEPQSIRIPDL